MSLRAFSTESAGERVDRLLGNWKGKVSKDTTVAEAIYLNYIEETIDRPLNDLEKGVTLSDEQVAEVEAKVNKLNNQMNPDWKDSNPVDTLPASFRAQNADLGSVESAPEDIGAT